MNILVTGANGYIGKRLIPILLTHGHSVLALVRDRARFSADEPFIDHPNFQIFIADLMDQSSLMRLPKPIDIVYYLVHAMSTSYNDFVKMEKKMAENFSNYLNQSSVKQCIYLSGIVNDDKLSPHLLSRLYTEEILKSSDVPVSVLRAAIIIGSGSASFEIIRDLVEKLPIMVAPKWLKTKCQPICIRDVLSYLIGLIGEEKAFNNSYDIGGPEVLSYRDMLQGYAHVRNLKRWIISVPLFSPKLSSYWLYFVTSTSYNLAKSLVSSMKNEVVVKDNSIKFLIQTEQIPYTKALQLAIGKIRQNSVVSSWKDAISSGKISSSYTDYIQVPDTAVFVDQREYEFPSEELPRIKHNVWSIGGRRGWYFGNWLWKLRGLMDKAVGGVGLRRGRRNNNEIVAGDSVDFWRVLIADKKKARVLLLAEMKLPGEAWLEFRIKKHKKKDLLILNQTATFRPKGVLGRLYWYLVLPLHYIIFPGMAKGIINYRNPKNLKDEPFFYSVND